MTNKTLLYALLVWFILGILAIVNGVIRNTYYTLAVGGLAAHQISTAIFVAVVLIVACIFVKAVKPADRELIFVGLFWVSLTVVFETIFGHYVMGYPWSRIVADYNIAAGRVWGFVLLVTFFAPLIARKVFRV